MVFAQLPGAFVVKTLRVTQAYILSKMCTCALQHSEGNAEFCCRFFDYSSYCCSKSYLIRCLFVTQLVCCSRRIYPALQTCLPDMEIMDALHACRHLSQQDVVEPALSCLPGEQGFLICVVYPSDAPRCALHFINYAVCQVANFTIEIAFIIRSLLFPKKHTNSSLLVCTALYERAKPAQV